MRATREDDGAAGEGGQVIHEGGKVADGAAVGAGVAGAFGPDDAGPASRSPSSPPGNNGSAPRRSRAPHPG